MDDSNFASLSPTLLARKGGAKPAMRPQHGPLPSAANAAHNLEDLGWNDMGADEEPVQRDAEVIQLTPEPVNPDALAEAKEVDRAAQAVLGGATAGKPAVLRQQEEIAEKIGSTPGSESRKDDSAAAKMPAPEPVQKKVATPVRARRSALQRGKRAAFTLRLDAERHLKLRLACTLRGKSAQQLVTDALDGLLAEMPDVDSLAAQVGGKE